MAINTLSHLRSLTAVPDPIHGYFKLNIFDRDLVDSEYFQRLHFVLQNSANYVSFPSNKNSRFPHSLGVAHGAGRMFSSALSNSSTETLERFLDSAADYLDELIDQVHATSVSKKNVTGNPHENAFFATLSGLSGFVHSPIAPQIGDSRVDTETKYGVKKRLSATFVVDTIWQAVRLYGLMHDIGHLPMSHAFELGLDLAENLGGRYEVGDDFEDQIRELMAKRKSGFSDEKDIANQKELYELFSVLFSNPKWTVNEAALDQVAFHKALHEVRGLNLFIRFVRYHSDVAEAVPTNTDIDNTELRAYAELIQSVTLSIYFSLYFVSEGRELGDSHPFSFLYAVRQIVDGNVDADRIDYTLRDCHESGARFGTFDLEKILDNSVLLENKRKTIFNFGFHFRAVPAIEQFFEARYQSYKYVVYHRTSARTNKSVEQLVALLFVQSIEYPLSAVGKIFERYGYLKIANTGKVESVIPDENSHIRKIDDYTFRSMLFEIAEACTKELSDSSEVDKGGVASLEGINCKLLTDIKNLIDVFLLRDFGHIFTVLKRYTAADIIYQEGSRDVPKEKLEAFYSYVIHNFTPEKQKIVVDTLNGVEGLNEDNSLMVMFDSIESKTFIEKSDFGDEQVPFEERVLVQDGDGVVQPIRNMSSALRIMPRRYKDDKQLRIYAVSRNIKNDLKKIEKIEEHFMTSVVQNLAKEFMNSPKGKKDEG